MFRRKLKNIRIKTESRAGSSLIMVVCVSAFLVAFALAMVYTGSMLMARANRRLEQERCYQLASSFAKVLDGELELYGGRDLEALKSDPTYNNSFYRFACQFLEDSRYQEYNPEHPELTTFYYRHTADAGDDNYGKATIILYKENDQETDVMTGMITNPASPGAGGSGTDANPIETVMANISRFTLHVEVVAELDGMTYSYSTAYDTQVRYTEKAVEFTVDGDTIHWKDNKWTDNNGNELSLEQDALISYKISPSLEELSECTFTKTISEGANPEAGGGGGVGS